MNINDISTRFQESAVRVYDPSDYYVCTSTAAKCLFDGNGELRVKLNNGKPELIDIYNGNTYELEKRTLFFMIVEACNKRAAAEAQRIEEELRNQPFPG